MIYVNDELINFKKPEWAWLQEEFEAIRKISSPIRIKLSRLPVIEKGSAPGMNPTGLKEPIKTYQWRTSETIIREGMTETWTYTKNKPSVKDGELIFKTRYFEIRDGALIIDPKNETDLAYFVLYVSSFLKRNTFIVEDLEKEAQQKIDSIAPDAMVIFYLNSPISPLYNKNELIRELAYSWGVSNADSIGINQVKLKLKDHIMNSQFNYSVTNRGINEFIEEVSNMGRMTKYRALLRKTLDKNLIGFDTRQNAWCWVSRVNHEFTEYLLPVLPINLDQKERLLFEYLINNAQIFDQLEEMLKHEVKQEKTENTMAESKYAHLKWPEIKQLAKSKGISVFGKQRIDLEAELLQKE